MSRPRTRELPLGPVVSVPEELRGTPVVEDWLSPGSFVAALRPHERGDIFAGWTRNHPRMPGGRQDLAERIQLRAGSIRRHTAARWRSAYSGISIPSATTMARFRDEAAFVAEVIELLGLDAPPRSAR